MNERLVGRLAVLADELHIVTSMGRSAKRYTKFIVVGAMNAVADLAVLNGLLLLSPTKSTFLLFVYNTVAVVCAIVNSYFWNRHWTFADSSDGSAREKKLFIVQALLNLAINDLIVVWLSAYLVFSRSLPFFLSSNASKGLAMFLSSSISYVLMRLFVFRGRRQKK